jgi:hypothetical protein
MIEAIDVSAFVHFEIPIYYMKQSPELTGHPNHWPGRHQLPAIDRVRETYIAPPRRLAEAYFGWHEDFVAFGYSVKPFAGTFHVDASHWWKGDGARLCIDTRDARDSRQGTRYSHFFYVCPTGGESNRRSPLVGLHALSRAKEHPTKIDASQIRVAVSKTATSYGLEMLIPSGCLTGWNPSVHTRIGLYYKIKSADGQAQHLTVPDDFGWNADPSTWATGVLEK